MGVYNASSLIKALQRGFGLNQENAGKLLLDAVVFLCEEDVVVNARMITNLVHMNSDVHNSIRRVASLQSTVPEVRQYVQKDILGVYAQVSVETCCADILSKIKADRQVPAAVRKDVDIFYNAGNYKELLTTAFLYAFIAPNTIPEPEVHADDFYFLEEAQYACPLCGQNLWKKVRGIVKNKYRVVQVFPESLEADLEAEFLKIAPAPRKVDADGNRIALCEECAEAYMVEPTVEDFHALIERKIATARVYAGKLAAAETKIEDEIADVIKAISGIQRTTVLKPFTDVLTLGQKIRPDCMTLHNSIEDDVIRYYPYIEEQFSLLDGVNGNSFNVIRSEITSCYEKLEAAGNLSQEEIFDALTEWVLTPQGLGSRHRTAGRIVVSFFVQNCSVFKQLPPALPATVDAVE